MVVLVTPVSECVGHSLVVGEMVPPPARRRAMHDHTAALTGCFASRQHRSLARPVRAAAVFGAPMAGRALCPPDGLSGSSGCEGTMDILSRQQISELVATVAAQVWQKAQAGSAN